MDHQLGSLAAPFIVGAAGQLTDGQLLERFQGRRDEVGELAFAALVERHGRMVLHACRSILRNEHAAQDAFQATFVVLARKAGSLWVKDSTRSVAPPGRLPGRPFVTLGRGDEEGSRTKGGRADCRASGLGESRRGGLRGDPTRKSSGCPNVIAFLIVLCDLEGQTHELAARHLGCPVGTVKSRLARGRDRLRARLQRRGIIVPASALVAGFLPRAVRATAIGDGMTHAFGQNVATEPARLLMKSVFQELLMNKLKIAALGMVTIGAIAGVGGLTRAGLGGPGEPSAPGATRPALDPKTAGDVPDLRGSWELLYLAGTVNGERQGFLLPNLVVPLTNEWINLPGLTGKANDPINYLGATPYTLDPKPALGAIDIDATPARGKALRGICHLKDDILTICYDEADRDRPATFADITPTQGLIILRRPRAKPKPPIDKEAPITTAPPRS